MARNEKRQALQEAALACLMEQGYARTSVRDIAAKAGVTPGHIHYYFESKEALFHELFRGMFHAGGVPWEGQVFAGLNPDERLYLHVQRVYTMCRANNGAPMRVYLDLLNQSLWEEPLREIMFPYRTELVKLIQKVGPQPDEGPRRPWSFEEAEIIQAASESWILQSILGVNVLSAEGFHQQLRDKFLVAEPGLTP